MDEIGQLFTAATWTVKPGREGDFIRAWDEFAKWTSHNLESAGQGQLVQDLDDPTRFLSFGPWESAEHIAAWRARPEFTSFMAKARELCDEIQPRTLKVVARSK
jgi:heme-degrading monooxygenase HmoA